jgi:hypothetical protein
MIELTIESLADRAGLFSAGRRAASKTNKTNTMARRVSMIGGVFEREIYQIAIILLLQVDP